MKGEGIYTHPDTPLARQFGFTSSKFDGILWVTQDTVYIVYIRSLKPGRGNLRRLFNKIIREEYNIKVVQPVGVMVDIMNKYKFMHTYEDIDNPQLPRVTVYVYMAHRGRLG